MNPAALYERLLEETRTLGTASGRNLVAFSGGVDSALVAQAVFTVFPHSGEAVLGVSPSLSAEQRASAFQLAEHVGIPLRLVDTDEGADPVYIANEGLSCYVCKSVLYETMRRIDASLDGEKDVVLFNGTNADDMIDPTRVGLRAAREYRVASPLASYTKEEVRAMSRHAGLPNWNAAAAPCLRSRLQFGVPATAGHLARIDEAEQRLRARFAFDAADNLRVRHLAGDAAMIEADSTKLPHLTQRECEAELLPLGFTSVSLRAFVSGGVSGFRPPAVEQ